MGRHPVWCRIINAIYEKIITTSGSAITAAPTQVLGQLFYAIFSEAALLLLLDLLFDILVQLFHTIGGHYHPYFFLVGDDILHRGELMVEIAFRKVNDLALDPGYRVGLFIGILLQ